MNRQVEFISCFAVSRPDKRNHNGTAVDYVAYCVGSSIGLFITNKPQLLRGHCLKFDYLLSQIGCEKKMFP